MLVLNIVQILKNAIDVIYKVLEQFEEISKDSKAQVGIKEFADASINIELEILGTNTTI